MGLDVWMEKSKLEMQFCITMQKIRGTDTRCATPRKSSERDAAAADP